jgi:hypothetical protein
VISSTKGKAIHVGEQGWPLIFNRSGVAPGHSPQCCAVKEGSDVVKIYMTSILS